MCDINKKTTLKRKTVYKVVYKANGNYYSCFAYKKLSVGKVVRLNMEDWECAVADGIKESLWELKAVAGTYMNGPSAYFNNNLRGMVSGFNDKNTANKLCERIDGSLVVKIVLSGEVWEGTGNGIADDIGDFDITYAGSEILSIEEV